MGKRRKSKEEREPKMLAFDIGKRQEYLLGFRKRKEERRKKAQLEDMEKERKDRIDVKREHRENIKKQWKEMQRIESLNDSKARKALVPFGPSLEDDYDDDYEPAVRDYNPEPTRERLMLEAPVTVAFDKAAEDDDPFGDCEVTTTAVCDGVAKLYSDETAVANWPSLLTSSSRALVLAGAARKMQEEDPEARAARRAENYWKEEHRRKAAAMRTLTKRMVQKEKEKKKKSKPRDKKKNTKKGAKARRKRKNQ